MNGRPILNRQNVSDSQYNKLSIVYSTQEIDFIFDYLEHE